SCAVRISTCTRIPSGSTFDSPATRLADHHEIITSVKTALHKSFQDAVPSAASWFIVMCAMKRQVVRLAIPFVADCALIGRLSGDGADAKFKAFWEAKGPQEAAKLASEIVTSGVTFEEAAKRLKAGRPYSANVAKGVVKASYRAHGREFFYAL